MASPGQDGPTRPTRSTRRNSTEPPPAPILPTPEPIKAEASTEPATRVSARNKKPTSPALATPNAQNSPTKQLKIDSLFKNMTRITPMFTDVPAQAVAPRHHQTQATSATPKVPASPASPAPGSAPAKRGRGRPPKAQQNIGEALLASPPPAALKTPASAKKAAPAAKSQAPALEDAMEGVESTGPPTPKIIDTSPKTTRKSPGKRSAASPAETAAAPAPAADGEEPMSPPPPKRRKVAATPETPQPAATPAKSISSTPATPATPVTPKPRGRPKKDGSAPATPASAPPSQPTTPATPGSAKKPRGRPPRKPLEHISSWKEQIEGALKQARANAAAVENQQLFPRWLPRQSDIKVITENVESYLPTVVESRKFVFVDAANEGAASSQVQHGLTRFGSITRRTLPANLNDNSRFDDVILHAGGPIWALDWCPRAGSTMTHQYLALSAHKSETDYHVLDTAYNASNIIQIWDCGILGLTGANRKSAQPKLAFGIAHSGGCAFELTWCPRGTLLDTAAQIKILESLNDQGSNSGGSIPIIPRLGLLAGVFADGAVRVWAVPDPNFLKAPQGYEGPLILDLAPVVEFDMHRAAPGNLLHTVNWNPHGNCDRLLAGGSNGCIVVFKLSDDPVEIAKTTKSTLPWGLTMDEQIATEEEYARDASENLIQKHPIAPDASQEEIEANQGLEFDVIYKPVAVPLFTVKALQVPELFHVPGRAPIRQVLWSPRDPTLFVVASIDTLFRVYDLNNPFQPLMSKLTNSGFITSIEWINSPIYEVLVTGLSDGEVKHNSQIHSRGFNDHKFSVWSVHCSLICRQIASCAADGTVYMFPLLEQQLLSGYRKRALPDATQVEGMKWDEAEQILTFWSGPTPDINVKPPGQGMLVSRYQQKAPAQILKEAMLMPDGKEIEPPPELAAELQELEELLVRGRPKGISKKDMTPEQRAEHEKTVMERKKLRAKLQRQMAKKIKEARAAAAEEESTTVGVSKKRSSNNKQDDDENEDEDGGGDDEDSDDEDGDSDDGGGGGGGGGKSKKKSVKKPKPAGEANSGKPFPPAPVAIHRMRWNLNPSCANWIAYGGFSGLLRVRIVRSFLEDEPKQ